MKKTMKHRTKRCGGCTPQPVVLSLVMLVGLCHAIGHTHAIPVAPCSVWPGRVANSEPFDRNANGAHAATDTTLRARYPCCHRRAP